MKIFIIFLFIFSLFSERINLSDGKSLSICDEKIFQQYNVNPTTCSPNFVIIPSTSSYTIDGLVHVTIRSTTSDTTFIGIYLMAQDNQSLNIGSWKTSGTLRESAECGGLMHNSDEEKTSVDAVWQAPSNINGNIVIKAIIIEDENTIYVDCYNIVLTPRGLNSASFIDVKDLGDDTTTTTSTTSSTTSTTETSITSSTTSTTETSTTSITTSTTATLTTASTSSTTIATTTTQPATTTNTTQSTTTASTTSNSTPVPTTTTQTPSPTADVSLNVTWTFNNQANITNVLMTVNNLQSTQWAAIGLGLNPTMGETHVFMCKRLADGTIVVNRYINPGDHNPPEEAGSKQGGTFAPGQTQFLGGVVKCQFTLSNFSTGTFKQLKDILPLSQSTKYHPIFAVGFLNDDNYPKKHADDSRIALPDLVQLNLPTTILYKVKQNEKSHKLLRAHGIIMILTWILIVSTGILISRYFKTSWTSIICGKAGWFTAHRYLMSTATVLTMLGFLFVLVFNGGEWEEKGPTRVFAHSITGVLVISFAFFQPFIALFRCEPNSQYRFIFNYLHGFVGFSAFILSIATLFLATYFELFEDNRARVIMIIWVIWVVFIFSAFETIQFLIRKESGNPAYSKINTLNTTIEEIADSPTSPTATTTTLFDNKQEATGKQKAKNILLAVHILVAAILSIIFATLIT